MRSAFVVFNTIFVLPLRSPVRPYAVQTHVVWMCHEMTKTLKVKSAERRMSVGQKSEETARDPPPAPTAILPERT